MGNDSSQSSGDSNQSGACVGIQCWDCSNVYYRCYSDTWNIKGTVTRKKGYCHRCCGGWATRHSSSGHTVDMRCLNCNDIYNIITWSEWKRSGNYFYKKGFCEGCYRSRKREKKIAEDKAKVVKKTEKFIKQAVDKMKLINDQFDKSESKSNLSIEDLTTYQHDITTMIQNISAGQALGIDIINNSKSETEEISSTPTYESKDAKTGHIHKLKALQQKVATLLQKKREAGTKLNNKIIENKKHQNKLNKELIKSKEAENKMNEIDNEISLLQKEIVDSITGDDVATNRDAVDKMNKKVEDLICLMKQKHAENTQRISELNDCQTRIHKIHAQLVKAKSDNIYLMELLNEEYTRVTQVEKDVIKKWEERGIYFLSVTVELKEDVIQLFINQCYEKLDDIKSLCDSDLIDIGIDKKGIRDRILRCIRELNNHSIDEEKKTGLILHTQVLTLRKLVDEDTAKCIDDDFEKIFVSFDEDKWYGTLKELLKKGKNDGVDVKLEVSVK
eukprot:79285_1